MQKALQCRALCAPVLHYRERSSVNARAMQYGTTAQVSPIAAAAASCGALVAANMPPKPTTAPINDMMMVTTHINLANLITFIR